MGRRPKTTPAHEIRTRRGKVDAKDAKSAARKPTSHQDPETADEAQTPADVAQDEAETAETALPEPETAGDVPEDGQEAGTEGVETGDVVRETEVAEVASAPDDAGTIQPDVQAAPESIEPTSQTADTSAALALRRWRERPTCCCGCGQALSSSKKNFAQGHDGRAKKIVRAIMKGEMPAGEAPTELILRHAEIKFIMRSPEFHRVVEMWREICGLTHTAAGK